MYEGQVIQNSPVSLVVFPAPVAANVTEVASGSLDKFTDEKENILRITPKDRFGNVVHGNQVGRAKRRRARERREATEEERPKRSDRIAASE
jgi:hypothetical protein